MYLIQSRWVIGLLAVITAAAVFCGVTDRTLTVSLPVTYALLLAAAFFLTLFFVIGMVISHGRDIEWPVRLSMAVGGCIAGLITIFPTLVLVAAPVWFILTGALWTSLIVAVVAAIFVARLPPLAFM